MAGMAEDNIVIERGWGTVEYAVRQNGRVPARDFIEHLTSEQRIKLETLFERMAEHGQIHNKQKFRKLHSKSGKVWEFKSGQYRVLCFQCGRSWILTHGFQKKQDKTPRNEIKRAESIMTEHLKRFR